LRGFFEQGYGAVVWGAATKGCHVVAFEIVHGPVPEGSCVLHECDNRACCNPKHLFLGTKGDNARDAVSKDRHTRGERHTLHKLTDETVIAIRDRYVKRSKDNNLSKLAKEYGVSDQCIWLALQGKSWKHI
jgi:hypothetical protein